MKQSTIFPSLVYYAHKGNGNASQHFVFIEICLHWSDIEIQMYLYFPPKYLVVSTMYVKRQVKTWIQFYPLCSKISLVIGEFMSPKYTRRDYKNSAKNVQLGMYLASRILDFSANPQNLKKWGLDPITYDLENISCRILAKRGII